MPKKKKNEITIRSSAAEYLTYVASVGGEESSVEMRYPFYGSVLCSVQTKGCLFFLELISDM